MQMVLALFVRLWLVAWADDGAAGPYAGSSTITVRNEVEYHRSRARAASGSS